MKQPVIVKMTRPTTCTGRRPAPSTSGTTKKAVVVATDSAVAKSPGRRPPYQAAAITAPKNVR